MNITFFTSCFSSLEKSDVSVMDWHWNLVSVFCKF